MLYTGLTQGSLSRGLAKRLPRSRLSSVILCLLMRPHILLIPPLLARRLGSIIPELQVSIRTQRPPLAKLPLLPQQLLDIAPGLAEDLQIVRYDVPVLAGRARNQYGAVVVALFGDDVLAARAAGHAREGEFVLRRRTACW